MVYIIAQATLERERSISSAVIPLRSHIPRKMPFAVLNKLRGVSNSCSVLVRKHAPGE